MGKKEETKNKKGQVGKTSNLVRPSQKACQ